jgi:hypothetical protein
MLNPILLLRPAIRNCFRCSEAGLQIVLAPYCAEMYLPHKKQLQKLPSTKERQPFV